MFVETIPTHTHTLSLFIWQEWHAFSATIWRRLMMNYVAPQMSFVRDSDYLVFEPDMGLWPPDDMVNLFSRPTFDSF